MRINELIVEEQTDEGLGAMIGKGVGALARGVGATVGGAAGAWDAAKQGYRAGKAAVAGRENPDDADPTLTKNQTDPSGTAPAATSGTATAPAASGTAPAAPASSGTAPASSGTAPAAGGTATAPAPAASSSELDQLKATLGKLNPEQKKELAGELEKSMNAPAAAPAANSAPAAGTAPAGQGAEIDPAKAAADKQAKNAADAAERDKQIAATKAANAQTAQADNALVAAVKAAKAKPAFQQTAQDKLTIKQGAEKGIHESKKKKKKKVVAEFKSNFLDMVI